MGPGDSLQEARHQSPRRPDDHSTEQRHSDRDGRRKLLSVDSHRHRADSAHKELALRSDVEEAGPEADGDTEACQKKWRREHQR